MIVAFRRHHAVFFLGKLPASPALSWKISLAERIRDTEKENFVYMSGETMKISFSQRRNFNGLSLAGAGK